MVFSLFSPLQTASANELKPFKPTTQSESTMQLKAAIADQLNVLEGGPKLHKELQGLSGNQGVDVIIHLSEKPVALEKGIHNLSGKAFSSSQEKQVRTKVQAQQNFVLKELALNNINIQQGYTFDTVLNGFSAKVKADDLEKLLTVQGITLVEPDTIVHASEEKPLKTKPTTPSNPLKNTQMEAMMNTSISFLGIEKLWNEGIEGQGIKVAVLDTGIDANHPEFAGIYKGGKNFIPNSSSYTRNRANDDASETSPVERPAHMPEINEKGNSFYTSHGTHVAGTIAAIGANEYGIKGIAPKVDLYAYRVLGAYGSGATSGIVKAIDTAVIEKMDVINLSLGGGANTETDSGSFAINNAMMAGTISVIATGNEGPNRGTMGTPATARLGIAVGNTSNPETMHNGKVNVAVGSYNLTKQLQLMGTTFGRDLATQLQGEFEIVAVPGNGEAKDYNGIDVKGKVALISRGSIAFVDKIAHAKDNGAVATIIHNFAGGTNAPNPSGAFLGDSFELLPTFDLSQTDGEAIRAALKQGAGTVSFGNFGSTRTTGDEVNDSSSRGPSTPNFDIKPDVSAPGTNIMSTIPMYKADFPDAVYSEAYDRKTGTSMATPHIAGIAALIKQANPSWNAFDVKVALSNTAKLLDKTKYDVFSQGAGRVDAYAAARPDVLAYALDKAVLDSSGTIVDNLKGTVTFGPQPLTENVSVTKQILVKDTKGIGGNYDVTVDVTKSFGDAKVTVDKPTFTLAGEQLLNVTLTASKATAPSGSEILGYIHINGGGSAISLPFAADFSTAAPTTEIKNMAITGTDLSFNGDGVKDSAVLSFTLTGDVTTNFIEIWDIMNPDGGEYGDGYIGYLHASSSLGKGSYTLNVNGQYRPWGGTGVAKIPDGLYTIDFSAQAGSTVIGDYVGPIVVKTTKPVITGSVAEKIATGKVVDKYIEYNEELYLYDLDFDLNEKLHASYVATIAGKEADAVPFNLAQDGTFAFPVTDETEAVKVIVKDEAGNVGEALIYEKPEPEAEVKLSVSPTELKLKTGEKGQVTVTETTTPANGDPTNKDVTAEATYVVTDESVATVVNGEVTAVAKGSTTITIAHGKNEVKVNVTVEDPAVIVPGVTLTANKTEFDLEKGKEAQLVIKEVTTAADGTTKQKDVTKAATYKVADSKVASVKNGLITAKNAGTTTITVKYGKNELTVNVTVSESVVTLTANKTEINLELGKEAQLAIKEVTTAADGTTKQKDVTTAATYKVADSKVVSVKNGLIISKNIGSTEITVKYGKNELTVYVTVSEKGVTLTTNKTDITLESGKESQLKITEETTAPNGTVKKTDVTKQATYVVANENVATVKNGLITAKEAGSTTISVKYGKNELSVNVTVTKPTVTLTANKTQLDLEPQKEAQLVIKEVVTGADGKTKQTDVTNFAEYKVANTNVASVSKTGLVRAKNEGNTTITVKYGGNELTVDVNVIVPVVTLEVDKTHVELLAGKEANLKVKEITTTADGQTTEKNVTQNATYKVADNKVATVKEGKITAKAEGETAVTVKYGKNEVVVIVTVKEPKVEITVDQTQLNLLAGDEAQLTVKEVTTSVDGEVKERDVTTAAKYKVADGQVVAVSEGKVRAKAAGTTIITVVYNKMEVTVDVTVSQPEVILVTNLTDINLNLNQQAQLYISEMTTMPDGTVFERDVTQAANYVVADKKIVTVTNGLVSPRKTEGSTTITVKYGKMELVVNVNVGNFVKMDSPYIFDNPLFNENLLNEDPILTEEIVIPTMPSLNDSMLHSSITPIGI
ncbi:S8 family serine peptidase [Solibacillus sp. MA9]|uniref:S8 family serine peptidase n=2 Tax=Solibacillus palustris TaxID=2908203 RepID=A0ABS9UC74_9BACL|nr:S8 family serine peptidase [Solibacillus sp. MA9]MCH7321838.1 S8 family serine peptidase [Solibacillus sp. MA9]